MSQDPIEPQTTPKPAAAASEPAAPKSRRERKRLKKERDAERRKSRSAAANLFHEWIKPLLIALAILLPVRSSIADWYDVPTGSMKPTIVEGDRIWVNKLAFGLRVPFTKVWLTRWDSPEAGDIVVCHRPDTNERLVKRVIAVGGDAIAMHNGKVFINGLPLEYGPMDPSAASGMSVADKQGREFAEEQLGKIAHAVMYTPARPMKRSFDSVRVPEGEIWVMGDNRDESLDSRAWQTVPIGSVVGQSGRVAISLDRENFLAPRFGRFLKQID